MHERNVWTLNYARRVSGDILSKTHKHFTLCFSSAFDSEEERICSWQKLEVIYTDQFLVTSSRKKLQAVWRNDLFWWLQQWLLLHYKFKQISPDSHVCGLCVDIRLRFSSIRFYTRVGTLIVATIYLQLI